MGDIDWLEIQSIQLESKHELTLSGDKIAEKVSQNNGMMNESLYEIGRQLNYLKMAKLGLVKISPKISNLLQLTQLSIIENKIMEIPDEISLLVNLVYFDLSNNDITRIPSVFNNLSKLRTLNLQNNQITDIASFNGLVSLQELFLNHNKLSSLPCDTFDLSQLMMLDLSYNKITDIPDDFQKLKGLKTLNLENNHINNVIPELGHMIRLKQIQLQNNPLKNTKTQLKKLINDNLYKAIIDYLKKMDSSSTNKQKRMIQNKISDSELVDNDVKSCITIVKEKGSHRIVIKNRSKLSRSQVVYFIVNELSFSSEKLKKFIKFQEQLHKDDCESRKTATIGVHDLSKINFPLIYSPKQSDSFTIQMMNFSKSETGNSLYERLLKEAETERKSKKRNNVSGVYQYLYMIDIDQLQGVVEDSRGTIVSYPPLTNCNATKMTADTTDILVEVIGTKLDKCKSISESIIRWLYENQVSINESGLEVEPVRVFEDNSESSVDGSQNLLVLFPSRADLNSPELTVIRE